MDPALLHQPQPLPFDFTHKFGGQGRSFSNTPYSANDLSFAGRRPQNNLTSGTSGVALPANPSLDYNGNSLLSDTPYHQSSQLLLSPPDSTTGSASTSGNPTTSSNGYTTLPKPFPSNACTSDHFSSAPPSLLSSNWTGPSMTVIDRPHRVPPLSPPQLSHPYSATSGIGQTIRAMERAPHYSTGIPSQISPGSFPQGFRYSSTYPRTNGPFPFPMPDPAFSGANMTQDSQSCAGRDGPPFHETNVHQQVLNMRGEALVPEITASIQKGFFQVDRKWTCYRRNYFAVQCAFSFRNSMAEAPLFLTKNGSEEEIYQFAVSISAKTAITSNGESETRGLVQHTPKREKATERVPGRQQIAPSHSHAMGANGTYTNAGHLYPGTNHLHSSGMGSFGSFEPPGANPPPTTYTFERIQFQKATANNGKRRAQQQYFLVVVELAANIGRQGHEEWVVIATKESDPMVVRGRSPGHYKDNGRRDSQASMDPDCGTGHGTSGHHGSLSSGSYGHGHTSVGWDGYGPNRHYGGSSYRTAANSRFSPVSVVTAAALGETTTAELDLSDSHTRKSSFTLSSDTSALTPLSEGSDDVMFSSLNRRSVSRKRPFDSEEEGDYLRFPLPEPYTDSLPSLPDFSTMAYSKLLCASS